MNIFYITRQETVEMLLKYTCILKIPSLYYFIHFIQILSHTIAMHIFFSSPSVEFLNKNILLCIILNICICLIIFNVKLHHSKYIIIKNYIKFFKNVTFKQVSGMQIKYILMGYISACYFAYLFLLCHHSKFITYIMKMSLI